MTINSKFKEAGTMKHCALIVYYKFRITKQSKLLNSHYSIVCSHGPIVCLITKNWAKMVEFSSFLCKNETYKIDSSLNEDSKNIIFFRGP